MTSSATSHFEAVTIQDIVTPWPAPVAETTARHAREPGLPSTIPTETLAQRLDWLLGALPVACLASSQDLRRAILRIDPAGRLVLRSIRLARGVKVDLVALPAAVANDPTRLAALRELRQQRQRRGLPMHIIREAVVAREPRLSQARLIADCAPFRPTARAARRLIVGLRARGGSALLRDCLAPLRGEADAACAVLALVGEKVLSVDLDEPLGPDTRVSLSPLYGFPS